MEILLKTNGADLESCKLSLEPSLKNASSLTAKDENCTAHLEAASNRSSKVEENANSLLADLDSCKLSLEAFLKNASCLTAKAENCTKGRIEPRRFEIEQMQERAAD